MVKSRACKTEQAVALFTDLYLEKHPSSTPPNQLKLKFYFCLSNSCQKTFQNIVTWCVESQNLHAFLWRAYLVVCGLMGTSLSLKGNRLAVQRTG